MKVACYFLSVALFLTLPISGPSSASPSANPVVEKVWERFQLSRFDTPIRGWMGLGGSDYGTSIEEFHGNSSDMRVDAEWCYRVIEKGGPVRAEWAFYALRLDPPLACRAERFQAIASGFAAPVLEAIRQELEARLWSRYGPSHEPEKKHGGYGEFKSAAWRNVRRWETPDIQIVLYISQFHEEPPSLGLLARHHHLRDAITAERKRPYWWKYGRWLEYWDTPVDRKLVEELKADFPFLPTLLLQSPPQSPKEALWTNQLRSTLLAVLNQASHASSERRAALLLAADRLAEKVHSPDPNSQAENPVQKELLRYGLNYEWNHLGSNWAYKHDLRQEVWKKYSTTEWGELAFVLLSSRGWATSVYCPDGSDEFRKVISRGEEFLAQRPNSIYRLDLTFMVAQAYETWWSASQASIQDTYVDRFRYHQGSAAALQKAITYYEKVMEAAPGTYEADYARWRLPRLKLGLDTGQRRFFCIYD